MKVTPISSITITTTIPLLINKTPIRYDYKSLTAILNKCNEESKTFFKIQGHLLSEAELHNKSKNIGKEEIISYPISIFQDITKIFKMPKPSKHISFPGITRHNFWNEIILRQRGTFPWTEDELKSHFKVTDEEITKNNQWSEPQLTIMANFIYDHIISHHSPTSSRSRFRPLGTSTPVRQGRRSQTPKARRTCAHCDNPLKDDNESYLCPSCHLTFTK